MNTTTGCLGPGRRRGPKRQNSTVLLLRLGVVVFSKQHPPQAALVLHTTAIVIEFRCRECLWWENMVVAVVLMGMEHGMSRLGNVSFRSVWDEAIGAACE